MDGKALRGGLPAVAASSGPFGARGFTVFGVVIAVALLVCGSLAAWSSRQDAWANAEQSADNLRLALEREIGRNITALDLSLQGAMEALAEPGLDQATPGVRRQALFDRSASAEDLGSIVILDADGTLVESSAQALPVDLNFSNRDYFTAQRDRPDRGLYISRVFLSRLNAHPSIAISRSLTARDGRFAGVVSGSLRLRYFRRLFETIDVGAHGKITLMRDDGRVVWRYPSSDGDADFDIGDSAMFRQMRADGAGRFVGPSAFDGVGRLHAFSHFKSLPLVLSIDLSLDDIFWRWRQKAMIIGPVLLLMCASIITLSLLFGREMRRRAEAERALMVAAADLRQMAGTDPLTGLANRRSFETAMTREWNRAVREKSQLSLLMIDADCFKSFNDLYGHPEGDRILGLISGCISAALRRPADFAARYGGEEFIALLPDGDSHGAQVVAEGIRAAVEALDLPHVGNPAGRVTVSIGSATARAAECEGATVLLKAADDALYEVKRTGRNRIRWIGCHEGAAPLPPMGSAPYRTAA